MFQTYKFKNPFADDDDIKIISNRQMDRNKSINATLKYMNLTLVCKTVKINLWNGGLLNSLFDD